MMHERRQSDSRVVPVKAPNNARAARAVSAAEGPEGRRLTKGNEHARSMPFDTAPRISMSETLALVRGAVARAPEERLTALFHHVYDVEHLREAYHGLRREAAPGADGETWEAYGRNLEERLMELSGRLAARDTVPRPCGG
jgi:RNA-directed DNA polymerase